MYKIKPNKKLGHRPAAGNVQQILQLPQHFQSTWPLNLCIELFSIPPCDSSVHHKAREHRLKFQKELVL